MGELSSDECHYAVDGGWCRAPAVCDSHDPDEQYGVAPLCADHALCLVGTTVPRDPTKPPIPVSEVA